MISTIVCFFLHVHDLDFLFFFHLKFFIIFLLSVILFHYVISMVWGAKMVILFLFELARLMLGL